MKLKAVLFLFSLLALFLVFSYSYVNEMEGLWVIEKVKIGGEEITPVGRWVRINKDFTQQSGNGWYQHSVGTWHYNTHSDELTFENINGYADNYEPFKVKIKNNKMYWSREEEGENVEVILKRSDFLPQSHIDKIMGVWDLTRATENGVDITLQLDPASKRYIYYRWDKRFVAQNTPGGPLSGIYNINGHKPEMDMIFDGENCKREKWSFKIEQDSLILTSIASEKKMELKYKRINYFPE
ncbi:hypothetical protein [Abyssalbus ytuae]|uniref:Uncharacterized protein n=1 Tax=Abyssalbus ytuae TaxID=2926907 RepID=A0A9E6ZLG9_9FLAO|nr:hypothetical protein [Abyssalbus ytuae]UOB16789.1 hypothetical protein MQE35_13715 [Abyssalbus ytuae]